MDSINKSFGAILKLGISSRQGIVRQHSNTEMLCLEHYPI